MASSTRSVVIHGHFYQPPREDPWLGVLEAQPTAAPFHDWNARIEAECYRAVVAARVLGPGGRIQEIINTLRFLSFNFGPTLLDWMEGAAPDTYEAILEADLYSRNANAGHGNALAQAYHHTILPLASRRDKITEVRWGIADFRKRFGREPEGMWLPETAVDDETLDVLAQEGVAFTIVAPHQVEQPPAQGLPGLYRTSGGRSIALFVYDGPISHDVAFGPLLKDADSWAQTMIEDPAPETGPGVGSSHDPTSESDQRGSDHPDSTTSAAPRRLVSLATDGETYGHHHQFGEMALASVLLALRSAPGVRIENFSSFLAHSPPQEEVRLVEPSSWSCTHGVDRWRGDCGCRMDPGKETQQAWRSPLRRAMTWLAERVHEEFEASAGALLGDPWEARDAFASVAVGSETMEAFLDRTLPPSHSPPDRARTASLLEAERNALRLSTSCGWFFDDLAGLEPIQILRYAARALELTGSRDPALESGFLSILEEAQSNEDPPRTGREIFLQEARPEVPAFAQVAAGTAYRSHIGGTETPPPDFVARIDEGGRIRVGEFVTHRWWVVETSFEESPSGELKIRVRPISAPESEGESTPSEYLLSVEDLPEAFRVDSNTSALGRALSRWTPTGAVEAMLLESDLPDSVLGEALTSGIRDLGASSGGNVTDMETLNQVDALALYHHQKGIPIPFDAQTAFAKFFSEASPEEKAALVALRYNLGFTHQP